MQKWSDRSPPKKRSKEESQFDKNCWTGKMPGYKHTREHAGDSQGSRLPAEVITESGNIA